MITPTPSAKLVRFVRYFHWSLGIFLLLSTLLLNSCSNPTTNSGIKINWHDGFTAPKPLLELAISENTSLPTAQLSEVLVAAIPTQEKDKQLYIFNYNSPTLCGRWGCLYVGYLDRGQGRYSRVLSFYLQPDLPPGKQLITVSSSEVTANNSSLPCLDVQQTRSNRTLQNLTYCFDGSSYQPVENSFLKLPTP